MSEINYVPESPKTKDVRETIPGEYFSWATLDLAGNTGTNKHLRIARGNFETTLTAMKRTYTSEFGKNSINRVSSGYMTAKWDTQIFLRESPYEVTER